MAYPTLVPDAAASTAGYTALLGQGSGDPNATARPQPNTPVRENDSRGFSLIRSALKEQGISKNATDIIIESWRKSTQKQYATYIQKWLLFSGERKISAIRPTTPQIIEFFTSLFDAGLKYSAIGTARSALSTFISVCSNKAIDLGNDPLVKRFMKGVFNKRPSLPRYTSIWDPEIVLQYLKSMGSDLSLQQSTYKCVMLLALLTGQRGQFLHNIRVQDLKFGKDDVNIQINDLMKQSRPGYHMKPFRLQQFDKDSNLCIVRSLKSYLSKTVAIRNDDKLFISLQAPHKGVSRGTISRWVKIVLQGAGIDTGQFSAHSTRAAASSTALAKGLPLSTILKAVGWSQDSTFRKFYNKPVDDSLIFQNSVLISRKHNDDNTA